MTEPFLFSGIVRNCYDSHVHWPSTGHWARRLSLHHLRSRADIATLNISPDHFEGDWLIGYGWDQNLFTDKISPTREWLDEKFPTTPVCFNRIDGHAVWANTEAFKRAGLWQKNITSPSGGEILLDIQGWPTGILIDQALSLVKKHLPRSDRAALKKDLVSGQATFHRAGFTHIRDLTCDAEQWALATELEKSGELHLAVEEFFSEYKPENFLKTLALCLDAQKQKSRLLRVRGVKVFYDGALGSEGAWLSTPYLTKKNSLHPSGLRLIEPAQLREMFIACAKENLILAVHVIGDQAAHEVVAVAHDLHKEKKLAPFELEHLELLRPDTLALLRGLPVTGHFQPCHWLSDKRWLKQKIGPLISHAFRWQALEEMGIPFYFGSDSPIEESSFARNLEAIADATTHSIPAPRGEWGGFHSHKDTSWPGDTYTVFRDGRPESVMWRGEKLQL